MRQYEGKMLRIKPGPHGYPQEDIHYFICSRELSTRWIMYGDWRLVSQVSKRSFLTHWVLPGHRNTAGAVVSDISRLGYTLWAMPAVIDNILRIRRKQMNA